VVEIVTAPNAKPNPGWLNFVRTGRARSKIRHYLKNLETEESLDLGEKLLVQALRTEGLELPPDDEGSGDGIQSVWHALVRWSGNRNRRELLIDIGLGRKIATIVAKRLAQQLLEQGRKPDAITLSMGLYSQHNEDAPSQGAVVIDGSENATVQLAHCCRPIPGDEITGYLGRGEGLVVHTADCAVAKRLFERDSERWISVEWSEQPQRAFETSVTVLVRNGKGVLADVAQAVSTAEADITHIDMGNERATENTDITLLLAVHDRQHLADVLRTLRRARPVLRVARAKPA
jgi:guanosine-3',5'-bis(diphosphate) 3'-pyrophosphohydrolase